MAAAISWWALDGCCYFLMDSGWLLLFPNGPWMVAVTSWRGMCAEGHAPRAQQRLPTTASLGTGKGVQPCPSSWPRGVDYTNAWARRETRQPRRSWYPPLRPRTRGCRPWRPGTPIPRRFIAHMTHTFEAVATLCAQGVHLLLTIGACGDVPVQFVATTSTHGWRRCWAEEGQHGCR